MEIREVKTPINLNKGNKSLMLNEETYQLLTPCGRYMILINPFINGTHVEI